MKRYISAAARSLSDVSWEELAYIAEDPKARPEVLREIYETKKDDTDFLSLATVFNPLAKNPNTPVDILERLFFGAPNWQKYNLVLNPNIPDHIFEAILDDTSFLIDYVLSYPDTPARVLTRVVNDANVYIPERGYVKLVTNDNIPEDLRNDIIASYPDWESAVYVDFTIPREDFDLNVLSAAFEETFSNNRFKDIFKGVYFDRFSEDGVTADLYFKFQYNMRDLFKSIFDAVDELLMEFDCDPSGHSHSYETYSYC